MSAFSFKRHAGMSSGPEALAGLRRVSFFRSLNSITVGGVVVAARYLQLHMHTSTRLTVFEQMWQQHFSQQYNSTLELELQKLHVTD